MKREYKVLLFSQTKLMDASHVEAELNGAAEKGYRVVSTASVPSDYSTVPPNMQRLFVIMERETPSPKVSDG